jgi:hypothetical protein
VRARVSRWLAVADEWFRIGKFMAAIVVLCVTQMLIATGPVGHTVGAWIAVGVLTAVEVVVVLLGMVRWPPR